MCIWCRIWEQHNSLLDESTFDFTIDTVKLAEDNVFSITFNKKVVNSRTQQYDWYAQYNYTARGQTIYYEQRINGLDSYLSTIIPEEELKKFDGIEVTFDQKEDVVKELKELYKKYE